MKISNEIKERLRRLEQEQHRQAQELEGLDGLRDLVAIAELERELSEVGNAKPKAGTSAKVQDMNVAQEIEVLDKVAATVKAKPKVGPKTDHDIDLSKESPLFRHEAPSAASSTGFVVCLLFNKASPSEWSDESGGGWRGRGMGTRYPSQVGAAAKLQELKAKWPDYPIEIRQ